MTDAGNKAAGVGKAHSFWLCLQPHGKNVEDLKKEAKRHRYIVLNAMEHKLVKDLREANPKALFFVYKDLSSTRKKASNGEVDHKHLPAGVGYWFAWKKHRDWFLRAGEEYLKYEDYDEHWQMDVGIDAYRECWFDNVLKEIKEFRKSDVKFDGIYMDNALVAADAYHPGKFPTKYPKHPDMHKVYETALVDLRKKFDGTGLKVVANMSGAREHTGVWNRYMKHLDGGFDEWWIALGEDKEGKPVLLHDYGKGWPRQVAEIKDNEQAGKITWVQPHFARNKAQPLWYAVASYFLAVQGEAAITEIDKMDEHNKLPPERDFYKWDLGAAEGSYEKMKDYQGLYCRRFKNGLVIVNPKDPKDSKNKPVKVQLGGTYYDEKKNKVTEVTLPSTSGTVLRKKP
ncbi:hypothetical protein J7S33_13310 [Saccharothrix algeriensis]|uniref:Uncharacterized protein n=1 Tax=Saccharothrix algeriensis TaxID=173560 RepID=A0A8T8I411_9PSEU|nr:hypothetical protein J7S33_13310 [Saccharothrix algeriensis]